MSDLDWGLLSNSVGPRVRLLRNNLNARSIAASDPFGLPTGSLTIMSLIAQNPGSSQKELADKAGITGPGLVSLVDDLERHGLVRRDRSTTDRRRNMLVLTDKGEKTVAEMFKVVSQIEAPIREELSAKELDQLIGLIDRVLKALGES
ncbi:MarR family transcriptional regulator [Aurantiacibacter xanthus]|uniref:MarR family transcriptional regulator n=1 Tax=Aurantiacibacter xanthus TaxID=1784712 RepID=A0A3A1PGU8_9SPHN|nr:MarR family winged helix-turn-helix transcriptional regulator [Aurantiacibacter xanthus]RIV92870.1 MarR family transcriptional regulator [Aurantiacibacter xanthus]